MVLSSSTMISQSYLGICIVAFLACLSAERGVTAKLKLKDNSTDLVPSISRAESNVKRSDFPSDFLFGAGSSAPQTEGSTREGGKGRSVFDDLVEGKPDDLPDSNKYNTATDSYKRYKASREILNLLL
ncbi:beta-glucosidase 24-like [Fagus crenata]